ncbi:MAG: hypothetical protein ACYDAQ_06895 [Mycobacteriales bacterium]
MWPANPSDGLPGVPEANHGDPSRQLLGPLPGAPVAGAGTGASSPSPALEVERGLADSWDLR